MGRRYGTLPFPLNHNVLGVPAVFRSILVAIHVFTIGVAMPAIAQRNSTPNRGGSQLPQVGTWLPVVSAFDEFGNEFSTSSLRGSYCVLVFGCLT